MAEKKALMAQAKTRGNEEDIVRVQTRVTKKRNNVVYGTMMKVVTITNQTTIETSKSPPVKKNNDDTRKYVIGDATLVHIDLKINGVRGVK